MTTPPPPDSNPYSQPLPPPYQPPYGQFPAPPAGNHPLAIAAMVVGIISICAAIIACLGVILGVTGAVMGHMSLNHLKTSGQGGRGMALTGVICGWIGCGLGILNAIAGAALRANGLM